MKLKEKFYDKPDATTLSLLQSIKMNPNFQKLISFSLNCLFAQMYLPNNKHRDNSVYIFKEGQQTLIQCVDTHRSSDQIICNVCGCLNRMVGLHKFRDEFIARSVIESNLSQVMSTIIKRQITIEAVRAIIDLYQNLTFTQLLTDSLAKSKILIGFIQILIVSKPPLFEIKKIFDLEYKILVQKCIIESIDVHELVFVYFELMQEYIDNVTVIKESLRILLLLINNSRCLGIIRQHQSIPIKNMSEILIQHNDIDVNDRGAQILQSIVGQEQIQSSIQSIKVLDNQAEFSMSLIACLIPAIHSKINLDELIQIIYDLIKNHKKIAKRKPILRDAINCLSRLFDQDSDYVIKLKQFLPLLQEIYDNDDTEVISASFDLSRKLGTNLTAEEQNKIIEKVITSLSQLKAVKDGLRLLLTFASKNDKTHKAISKGKEAFLKITENVNNQASQEHNSKLLLLIHAEMKDYLLKKLGVIVQFIQRHYTWKRSLFHYIQILNKFPDQVAALKSNLVISVLSCKQSKDYINIVGTLKQQKVDSEPEEDDPEEATGSFSQNEELEQQFMILIKNLTKLEDIKQIHKDIMANKYNDELSKVMLEIQLLKMAYYIQLEGIHYLQSGYFIEMKSYVLQLFKVYKSDLLDICLCVFLYLQSLSRLFWNEKTSQLYTEKQISQQLFDILFISLENEDLIESSFKTILLMGEGARNSSKKLYYLLDIQDNGYVIQLISQLQVMMKKYQSKIQLQILDVIRVYMLFDLFKSNIKDLPKILCRKLPEDTTTQEMGLETIQILQDMNYNENALKYVTLFQLQHQYDIEVINKVTPYVNYVQKFEGESFMTNDVKRQIKEMIEYFSRMSDPEISAEYMDKLSVYSQIPQALLFEFDCDVLNAITIVLQYCDTEPNNDRLLCSSVIILTQMLTNNYIEPTEVEKCFSFLEQKRHSENPVNLLTNYLSKAEKIITVDQLQFVLDLMEEYQRSEFVQSNLQEILYRSCMKSKELSLKLGDRRFIQRLLLQTQELIIERTQEEQAVKNLEWLENLSLSETVALIIQREKGREFCYFVIKHFIASYAFKILANLSRHNQSIPLSFFLDYIKAKQFIPEVLSSLDTLFENQQIKEEFLNINGQQLIMAEANNYPELCEKLLRHFKPQKPEEPRQSILQQRQSLLQQKQLLLQQQQQQEEEDDEEDVQVKHFDKSPEENKKLIDQCLELALNNPQQIIDEGMLERLFELPESWEVFRRLSSHQDMAELLLQPKSQLYKKTLQELKNVDGEYAAQVLETVGQISQVQEALIEFSQTEGPVDVVTLMEHQSDKPNVIESGLGALNKLCEDEMILSQVGDSNAIQLQKEILDKYVQNLEIIKQCDELISKMSCSETYQDRMAEVGIIQQLISQITQYPNDLEIVEPAIIALSKIVFKNSENASVVMESKIVDKLLNYPQEELQDSILTLINNLCYKNEEIRKQMNIEFLIKIFQRNIDNYKQKQFQECVNILFGMASQSQIVQKMMDLKFLSLINQFIIKQLDQEDSILLLLNLELKISASTAVPIDKQSVECILRYHIYLCSCLQKEKLEQQALRLLRQILPNGYNFILEGYKIIAAILKKAEASSCILTLDVMLKLASTNKESVSKFEEINVSLDFFEVLRTNKNEQKLFDQILEYSLKLYHKSNELANQLMVFIQQNEVTELQIDKTLVIVEEVDDNESFISFLIELMQRNNHRHTKSISIILSRESKVFANQVYVNKGIDACVNELKSTKEKEVIINLVKIIFDVAKSLEEYRQSIAENFLPQLDSNEPLLQELIKFLQGPKKKISRLTDEIKNFLLRGEILKMYKDDGSRGYYRFFCDENLQEIRCRLESTKLVKQKWILKINQIQEIKSNYDKKSLGSSAFENQNWLVKQIHKMKHKVIEPDRCFSLFAQKNVKPKSLNALCKSESQKNKWVDYIKILIDEN